MLKSFILMTISPIFHKINKRLNFSNPWQLQWNNQLELSKEDCDDVKFFLNII